MLRSRSRSYLALKCSRGREAAGPKEKEAVWPDPQSARSLRSREPTVIRVEQPRRKAEGSIAQYDQILLINIRYCLFHGWGTSVLGATSITGEEPAPVCAAWARLAYVALVGDVDTEYWELQARK